jgi:regulator of sirC expression with transglutaminase-like and TPR domain
MESVEKNKKMEALVSLIDEPEPEVFRDISTNILQFGTDIIPVLEDAWENQHLPEVQNRIESIIHQIQFDQVCQDLEDWVVSDSDNLLNGCIIIARYHYPELEEEQIRYDISRLRKDIWLELNENLTALEQIKVFNHVFYKTHGFSGNIANYHDPRNSYINKVLELKTGNPLSLGILYLILAQSLELPVQGINLPEHFVLAYTGNTLNPDTLELSKDNVLFYINAFSKGAVFSFKDIEVFLKQINMKPLPQYYMPCNNQQIIIRMLQSFTENDFSG